MNLQNVSHTGVITIRTTVSISEDNPAFDGHFPGFPVYPGVAQIQNVCDLLSEYFGKTVHLTQLNRVKFLSLITPSSVLQVICVVTARQVSWEITRINGPNGIQSDEVVGKGRGVFAFRNVQS
ncbi:MAG: hypothetical protein NTV34_11105 [Proteobacteria bacterium]|nr:hypothetical protein [Pseudomonadota bacterium]